MGVNSRNKKKGILVFIAILAVTLAVFVTVLVVASSRFQTETYYVLKTNVPTRTQITPDLLEPVVTSKDTAPATAIDLAEVQSGDIYSQYPLNKGDILTASNTTGFQNIAVGVPDDWVITSFGVGADDAVGGRIQRGTYFDMMVVTQNGAYYPFVNMLCLDTTISLSGASSSDAVNTDEAHSGQTSQYTVGMTPQDAAVLQSVVTNGGGKVKLVLSPLQNAYNPPDLEAYSGLFSYDNKEGEDPERYTPANQGVGTDFTFSPVKRDEFGRPLPQKKDCSRGNYKLGEKACKKIEAQLKREGRTLDEYLDEAQSRDQKKDKDDKDSGAKSSKSSKEEKVESEEATIDGEFSESPEN